MSETPAETLRRAATLIRERAEDATPGPWAWEPTGDDNSWALGLVQNEDGGSLHGQIETGEGIIIDGVCESVGGNGLADADHIASWSPPVALAVADWLDGESEWAETVPSHKHFPYLEKAVAVARTYLGEEAA